MTHKIKIWVMQQEEIGNTSSIMHAGLPDIQTRPYEDTLLSNMCLLRFSLFGDTEELCRNIFSLFPSVDEVEDIHHKLYMLHVYL